MDKDQAKELVKVFLDKTHERFVQELAGENDELLDRVLRQYRARVARCSWKLSQKWCKWADDGPVLMPDYTRIYYRKGSTEVILQEFPPQLRLLKFTGALAKRENSTASLEPNVHSTVFHYSLALPYTVFLFKFVNGTFTEVKCSFSDRPLKNLEERPLRPFFSNIDTEFKVCLGKSFDETQLEKGNIAQQAAYVLSHFWHSVFSDEWATHFWAAKAHFQANDVRLATFEEWEKASVENPLFVIEDVDWLKYDTDNFGDLVVRLFEDSKENSELHEDLYKELVENFMEDVKKTLHENIDSVKTKVTEALSEQLSNEFLEFVTEHNA